MSVTEGTQPPKKGSNVIDFPDVNSNTQNTSDETVLTVDEVAKLIRQTPAWVRAHAGKKRRPYLPGMKMGKYHRFRLSSVRHWMAQLEKDRA